MSTGHRTLDPVVVGMQVGMQVVFAGLVALVVVMAVAEPTPRTPAVRAADRTAARRSRSPDDRRA